MKINSKQRAVILGLFLIVGYFAYSRIHAQLALQNSLIQQQIAIQQESFSLEKNKEQRVADMNCKGDAATFFYAKVEKLPTEYSKATFKSISSNGACIIAISNTMNLSFGSTSTYNIVPTEIIYDVTSGKLTRLMGTVVSSSNQVLPIKGCIIYLEGKYGSCQNFQITSTADFEARFFQ